MSDKNLNAVNFRKTIEPMLSEKSRIVLSKFFQPGKNQKGAGDKFIGATMGTIRKLAKEFIDMPPDEIEKMIQSPIHQIRLAALTIMNFQTQRKRTPESRRKELFEIYLRQHEHINNWDLVDLGARYIVGAYLYDKKRSILYKLAKSKDIWERRTAMVCTAHFIKQKDLEDTYRLAQILINDKKDLIHKAIGWMLRYAGDRDEARLKKFLDKYASTLPRTALRYSIEHFNEKDRKYYMSAKFKAKS